MGRNCLKLTISDQSLDHWPHCVKLILSWFETLNLLLCKNRLDFYAKKLRNFSCGCNNFAPRWSFFVVKSSEKVVKIVICQLASCYEIASEWFWGPRFLCRWCSTCVFVMDLKHGWWSGLGATWGLTWKNSATYIRTLLVMMSCW